MAEIVLARGAVLLDSGGISALANGNPAARAVLVRARRESRQVAIPAAVLTEIITGRSDDAPINRVVTSVDFELSLSPARAREAGVLRARAAAARRQRTAKRRPPPSAVDATVMAEAAAIGGAIILTSDPNDMTTLRDAAGLSVREIEIIGV